MWGFFNSFGASTKFEKYRLEITAKNYESPDETSLAGMMKTFCSEDPQTKAQIAFATIIKKLLTSQSRNNWIYLLKNLIILDRVIEEGVFIEEISEAQFETLDNFTETDTRYMALDTQKLIKSFWKLIKQKSHVLKTKKHIFCYKRSQRQDYLSTLKAFDALQTLASIETFFALAFELIDVLSGERLSFQKPTEADRITKAREEFSKSRLLEYLYRQILHKLMLYYSCSMQCSNYFLGLLIKERGALRIEQVRRFRKHVVTFKNNADRFIQFVQANKRIKEFQEINYRQLNPFQKDQMLTTIDKVLHQHGKNETENFTQIELIGDDLMKVQRQPSGNYQEESLVPRRKQKIRRSSSLFTFRTNERDENPPAFTNPFRSWTNSYSEQFPQPEVMTVDLITLLKNEPEDGEEDQQLPAFRGEESRIFYDLRDTNVTVDYEVRLTASDGPGEPFIFKNMYSDLALAWNES